MEKRNTKKVVNINDSISSDGEELVRWTPKTGPLGMLN